MALKLAEHPSHNGRVWTTIEMLEDCIKNLQEMSNDSNCDLNYTKAIVLFLDDDGQNYITSYCQAVMNRINIVTLLEVMKTKFTQLLLGEEDG